jgi:hypothetical protein
MRAPGETFDSEIKKFNLFEFFFKPYGKDKSSPDENIRNPIKDASVDFLLKLFKTIIVVPIFVVSAIIAIALGAIAIAIAFAFGTIAYAFAIISIATRAICTIFKPIVDKAMGEPPGQSINI